jgi:hypothetical protein
MGGESRTVEEICAALASRSHGIVTRAELLDARGDDFRRYSYGDVCDNPRSMLRELSSVLRKCAA